MRRFIQIRCRSCRSASFVYLVIIGAVVGYTAYIWLLRHCDPAKVATYAYVNPIVAVFLGAVFAGETLTLRTLIGAGLIIGSVAIVIMAQQLKPKWFPNSRNDRSGRVRTMKNENPTADAKPTPRERIDKKRSRWSRAIGARKLKRRWFIATWPGASRMKNAKEFSCVWRKQRNGTRNVGKKSCATWGAEPPILKDTLQRRLNRWWNKIAGTEIAIRRMEAAEEKHEAEFRDQRDRALAGEEDVRDFLRESALEEKAHARALNAMAAAARSADRARRDLETRTLARTRRQLGGRRDLRSQ